MVLSGDVQWLEGLSFFSPQGVLLIEAVCAIAAKVGFDEVPMIVPKIMGPDIARCLFSLGLLPLDFVSQVSSRLAKI